MTRKISLVLLALTLALSVGLVACGAETGQEEEEEEFGPGDCIDFEDLQAGTQYNVGDTINTSGATITVEQFQGTSGHAEVGNQTLAGGSGKELLLKNVNARFDFGSTYQLVYILFGVSGGDLYLEINGNSTTVTDFSDIVTPFSGVGVRIQNQGNGKGKLKLAGTRAANITSLAIGGWDLAIDEVCVDTPAETTHICCEFENLTPGVVYHVWDTFTDNNCTVSITVVPFELGNGHLVRGYAEVDDAGLAGMGPGQEQDILVNNVTLNFTFSEPPTSLSLRYGEYGGNINIEVNNDFRNVDDFSDLVSPIGEVIVTTGNFGDGKGVISFSGTINSLAIGGQQLWIDHVCRFRRVEPSAQTYDLTIASSAGGSVSAPGEPGPFPYSSGTVVNLEATADACYYFVNWTGDVATVAHVNAASTTITMNGDYSITANFGQEQAVTFVDPNLEAAVRDAIGKPAGPICPSDLDGLTSLDAAARSITDLGGLEYATSLTVLYLMYNQIGNISPLANLTSLTELYLDDNQISDISPLATLINLTKLWLPSNPISDFSILANLTGLTWLNLENTQISDISILATLTGLTWIDLGVNQISDITALANLTSLTTIDLGGNQINDISPLVQNQGLGAGDVINLSANPLSFDSVDIYIPELQARGVTVTY